MSERFELSFKNKKVRVWLIIMIPTVIIEISLLIFTEIQQGYITGFFPLISWTVYFIWLYSYNRKQKEMQSVAKFTND